jgi:hypothetical protein
MPDINEDIQANVCRERRRLARRPELLRSFFRHSFKYRLPTVPDMSKLINITVQHAASTSTADRDHPAERNGMGLRMLATILVLGVGIVVAPLTSNPRRTRRLS